MENWLYHVWFRDNNLHPEEEDYEWVACIVIEAITQDTAKEWGDKLSKDYITRKNSNEFIKSGVEKYEREKYTDLSDVPFIKYGHFVSDEEIGW
jgi:hypothetical protein